MNTSNRALKLDKTCNTYRSWAKKQKKFLYNIFIFLLNILLWIYVLSLYFIEIVNFIVMYANFFNYFFEDNENICINCKICAQITTIY